MTDKSDKRNIILVTIDSLRADCCGYINDGVNLTPNLDRMADEGIAFENAVAPGPATYESMPAIFTGDLMTSYSAWRSGDRDVSDKDANTRQQMIGEWFKSEEYNTAAFTTNPHTGMQSNFSKGFDKFETFPVLRGQFNSRLLNNLPIGVKNLISWGRREGGVKPWTDYYQQILDWIENASEPYFLWIFLLDSHSPYLVDREYRTLNWFEMYYYTTKKWRDNMSGKNSFSNKDARKLRTLYEDTIRFTDEFFERINRDTQDSDPAFVVHADHGEAFGEHGTHGHQSQLYDVNVHVPFIVHNVGHRSRVQQPVSLCKLGDVLQRVACGEPEHIPKITSPYALSKTSDGKKYAIRAKDWKYIADVDGLQQVVNEEIYNLNSDKSETENIVNTQPELANSCRQIISSRLEHEHELITINDATLELSKSVQATI